MFEVSPDSLCEKAVGPDDATFLVKQENTIYEEDELGGYCSNDCDHLAIQSCTECIRAVKRPLKDYSHDKKRLDVKSSSLCQSGKSIKASNVQMGRAFLRQYVGEHMKELQAEKGEIDIDDDVVDINREMLLQWLCEDTPGSLIDVSTIPEQNILRLNDKGGKWKKSLFKDLKLKRPVFLCITCSSTFPTQDELTIHQLRHTEKRYLCHYCGWKIRTRSGLNHHLKTHSEERPFRCRFCEKSFNLRDRLKFHESMHTGDRPFRCEQCNAAFGRPSGLWRHRLRHTGVKAHRCLQCGAEFNQGGNLKVHMKIHTGEKPFRCEFCGLHFAWKNMLKKHMETCDGTTKSTPK